MNNQNNDFDIIKKLRNSSPYNPEIPQKKLSVNLIMQLAKRLKHHSLYTPHVFGGSNLNKVEYEYQNAHYLFEALETIDLSFFGHKEILDVGCGWGGKIIYYAEHSKLKSISGFDLPTVYVPAASYEYAKQKKITNCIFKTGFAENIPFNDKTFDIVIMEDVLEHVRDPQKVLTECYRVLRKKGTIIVKFPSIKMMRAHHLDRVINFPALHYILSLKTWARGLNYLLAREQYNFEPFEEVVASKFTKRMVPNSLNGLDFKSFVNLVNQTQFEIVTLKCQPFGRNTKQDSLIKWFYRILYNTGILNEFLSSYILFIGRKVN